MSPLASMHLLGSHQLGGAERFFIRLVEALVRHGHTATAVLRRDSPVDALLSPDVPRIHLPFASKWDLYTRSQIGHLVRQRRPHVVQTYMGRATRLTHLPPDGGTVHVARLGGFYQLKRYYEHAHVWVGNTRAICEYLIAAGFPAERVLHIGNFVPPPRRVSQEEIDALRARIDLPTSAFVIFGLGRLLPKKGFVDLLAAFARLPSSVEGRPLMLVVAGDGSQRPALERAMRDLGIEQRVRWVGWQNDPTPFHAASDLFVCPSHHEPLGNVLLEAWAHRRPVVTTRHEGAQELATDGVDALLAPMADPTGLAAALQRALDLGAAGRQRLADAGYDTVRREHGEDAVLGAYLALYERLTQRAGDYSPITMPSRRRAASAASSAATTR